MNCTNLIAVRLLRVGDRLVRVELFRNEGSSVAARCVLGSRDTPIIDAPSVDEALAAVEDALEGLLMARRWLAAWSSSGEAPARAPDLLAADTLLSRAGPSRGA